MHDMVKLLLNHVQSGYFSPEQIDQALNAASYDKFNEERKRLEDSSIISDSLRNFKTSSSRTVTAGLASLPSDYAHRLAATASSDLVKVDIVPESEWAERISDPIDAPSTSYPIMTIREAIQVYPHLTPLKLYYLKRPATIEYAYTDEDGDLVYDAADSEDSDWPDEFHPEIVRRSLVYLGVSLDDKGATMLQDYKRKTENV
jgi:hypothetical protein